MDKYKYLEDQIEFWRQQKEIFESIKIHRPNKYTEDELEDCQEHLDMFVSIYHSLKAWDLIKTDINYLEDNSVHLDICYDKNIESQKLNYFTIAEAIYYDLDNLKEDM